MGDGRTLMNDVNNNNNNSASRLAKRCRTKRPTWVYGAHFYSCGAGVADAAQLRREV